MEEIEIEENYSCHICLKRACICDKKKKFVRELAILPLRLIAIPFGAAYMCLYNHGIYAKGDTLADVKKNIRNKIGA